MSEIVDRAKIRSGRVYEDKYKMSKVGGGYMVPVPKIFVERKAREVGLSPKKFLKKYRVIVMFDRFDTLDFAYKFEETGI